MTPATDRHRAQAHGREATGVTDDPDELRYEQEARRRDPAVAIAAIEEIEVHLRYGIPTLKFLGWAIVVLLVLILWRIW